MKSLAAVLLVAASCFAHAAWQAPTIKGDDFKHLSGAQWTGNLTYLDYRKNKKVTIPANLIVTQATGNKPAWVFEIQYPDEPHANSKETVTIGPDGRTLNDEAIVERTTLPNGTLKLVTEKRGTDSDKPSVFRFTYMLNAKNFSIKKEVKHEGTSEFFERNEYKWQR